MPKKCQLHTYTKGHSMKKILSFILILPFVCFGACPEFYVGKKLPVSKVNLNEMCYAEFVVGYNPSMKTSFYSAEVLTTESVVNAKGNPRINAFHPNKKLQKGNRAELSDYINTGYDKGHLTPFGNMVSKQAEFESFDLVNIVPQNRVNNQQLWKKLEINVRELASQKGKIYVVTGPVFSDNPPLLKGKIPIPQYMYKAIYIPSQKVATVFLAENDDSWNYKYITVNQLKTMTGLDVFPSLPAIVKNTSVRLFEIKR